MNDMKSQAEAFLKHLRVEKQSSANTVLAYRHDLVKAIAYFNGNNIMEWVDVTSDLVTSLVKSLSRKKQKASSINRMLCAIRSLYVYMDEWGVCKHHPARGITGPRGAKKLPKVLDVDQASQLLDAEVADNFLGYRDQAILELFYSSALRLSELVELELSQLDLLEGLAMVHGKGSQDRIVPVGKKAREALAVWLQWRKTVGGPEGPQVQNVFVTHHGKPLTPRAVQKRVKEAGQRSLGRHLHPHILRHSCATHVLQSCHDLRLVQELLGHADIATTQIYTHLDLHYMRETIHTSHPRGKRVS